MVTIEEKKPRILIVDDEQHIRELLLQFLAERYHCEAVASADEAVVSIANGEYNVVISDVDMPNMNGIELCRRIKEIAADTALILMSGDLDDAKRTAAADAGASHCFQKPFDLKAIEAVIRQTIGQTANAILPSLQKLITRAFD